MGYSCKIISYESRRDQREVAQVGKTLRYLHQEHSWRENVERVEQAGDHLQDAQNNDTGHDQQRENLRLAGFGVWVCFGVLIKIGKLEKLVKLPT